MRVIEANQDNMKEGEYLEAMNALRDLHRNQEHDEEAITRPLREKIQTDMQDLWKWVCIAPFENEDSDGWYTSAQETMESWLDEGTREALHEWRDHHDTHGSEGFECCEFCGGCKTCARCECDEPEEEPEEEPRDAGWDIEQCEKCEEMVHSHDLTTHEFSTHDGDGNVVRKEGRTCSNCNRACVGCGSSEVVYWKCGGELGCNMCEKCFT